MDGSPRSAFAAAAQPSILLVVQRSAFSDLVRREPNLGMVVMRNIAMELAAKLRHADSTLASTAPKAGREKARMEDGGWQTKWDSA